MSDDNDCFPFLCVYDSVVSMQDARDGFKKELEHQFSFIRGYKYWRSVPRATSDRCYELNETTYRVVARLFSVLTALDGVDQADVDNYPPSDPSFGLKVATGLSSLKETLETSSNAGYKL